MIDGVLEDALAYMMQRKAFGKVIGQFQILQHYIADIATMQTSTELMLHYCASKQAKGENIGNQANMLKLFASENANHAADLAWLGRWSRTFDVAYRAVLTASQARTDAMVDYDASQRVDLDVAAGAEAAKCCAISLLAQLKKACGGDLSRVVRAVKLVGFVNSTADFVDQPKVINGASDFLVAALGDAGRHARSAVSAASLPLGVAVEIEGIFEIR